MMPVAYDPSVAFQAAQSGDVSTLREFLVDGPSKGHGLPTTVNGVGILEIACEFGQLDVVEFVLKECKPIVGSSVVGGWTALHAAAASGHAAIIRSLLRAGYEPRVKEDYIGGTPLHAAVSSGHLDATQALLEYGALHDDKLVNVTERNGTTPLHLASSEGFAQIATTLIEHGADIHAANITGQRPLHHAAIFGCRATAEVLIRAGADISIKDRAHKTAQQYNTRMFELLAAVIQETQAKSAGDGDAEIKSEGTKLEETAVVHIPVPITGSLPDNDSASNARSIFGVKRQRDLSESGSDNGGADAGAGNDSGKSPTRATVVIKKQRQ